MDNHLRRGVMEQLWWAPGIQLGSTHLILIHMYESLQSSLRKLVSVLQPEKKRPLRGMLPFGGSVQELSLLCYLRTSVCFLIPLTPVLFWQRRPPRCCCVRWEPRSVAHRHRTGIRDSPDATNVKMPDVVCCHQLLLVFRKKRENEEKRQLGSEDTWFWSSQNFGLNVSPDLFVVVRHHSCL
ncbi:uncharacterized protein FN964_013505 isoform 2-T2 [Alca torda]